jgi:hypothetical protein
VAAFQASHSQTSSKSLGEIGFIVCCSLKKSISSGSQYVMMQSKIRCRKVKLCRFGSGKWFWLSMVQRLQWLVKGTAGTLCTGLKRL